MRLFFALELPADLTLKIAAWRDRALPPAGRPVPPANFHITLAFLGEVPERRLDRLCSDVDGALAERAAPGGELRLDQVGYWPRPRIYWLGSRQWPEALGELARRLGGIGAALGDQRRRDRFQPHVTLLRGCDTPPPAPADAPDFTLEYCSFCLMESRQGRRGVSYHPVAGWELAPGAHSTPLR